MSERIETDQQVVIRSDDGKKTEVWEKNSIGRTTNEGYSKIVDGERYNYYGRHTGKA